MSKFKIGDKVKYIKHSFFGDEKYFEIGKVYVISGVEVGEGYYVQEVGDRMFINEDQLELVDSLSVTSQPTQDFAIDYNVTIKGQEFRLDHSEFKRLKNMINAIGEL